jgi:glycosyltransferase involved in cell wall biosynthesis
LIIVAKVDRVDRVNYETRIEPLLRHPRVEFTGEIGERDKVALLGGALTLLFPVDWPEPVGRVMIEAIASGTRTLPDAPSDSSLAVPVPIRTGDAGASPF